MHTPAASDSSSNATVAEDKTTAILSYLTLVGFIVAIIMHGSKKTRLGAFHLRQSLCLMLTAIALSAAWMVLVWIPFIGWFAAMAAWLGLAVLWVLGLVAAANGEQKAVPLLGEHFQKWFGNAFD
jgi:uncharacterized membrane protein